MLAVTHFNPTNYGWEFPIIDQPALDSMVNLEAMFLPNFPSYEQAPLQAHSGKLNHQAPLQAHSGKLNHDQINFIARSESPRTATSLDQVGAAVLAKKLNHNASERDRRKKINVLYSSLRALLPNTDESKKLSIPSTIVRVVKYIPELQKEVEDLIHKREMLLSKFSVLQGNSGEFSQEQKPRKGNGLKDNSLCSINVNKLDTSEIMIQIISTHSRISLPEVLLLLERNHGLFVIDVSTSQSCGGRAFYNVHLTIEGTNFISQEMLKEELHSLIEKHKQLHF